MYLSDKSSGRGGFEQIIKNKTTATWCYQWAFKDLLLGRMKTEVPPAVSPALSAHARCPGKK